MVNFKIKIYKNCFDKKNYYLFIWNLINMLYFSIKINIESIFVIVLYKI